MITKEQKIEIFKNTISGLRKKITSSNKDQLDVREIVLDRLAEKFRRLPLD
ncbi:hypothetical protein [Nitrosopumilus sp. S6]